MLFLLAFILWDWETFSVERSYSPVDDDIRCTITAAHKSHISKKNIMGKTLSARRKTNLQITIGKKEAHKSHISKKHFGKIFICKKKKFKTKPCVNSGVVHVLLDFSSLSSPPKYPLPSVQQPSHQKEDSFICCWWDGDLNSLGLIVVLYCPYSHFYLNVFSHSHAWNAQKVVSYYQNLFGMLCNILFWEFLQCIFWHFICHYFCLYGRYNRNLAAQKWP